MIYVTATWAQGCIPEKAAALMSPGKEGFQGPLGHLRVGGNRGEGPVYS